MHTIETLLNGKSITAKYTVNGNKIDIVEVNGIALGGGIAIQPVTMTHLKHVAFRHFMKTGAQAH